MDDVAGEPLETVDLAPGRSPAPELEFEPIYRRRERLELLLRRREGTDPEVVAEVRRLLASEALSTDFLEPPPRASIEEPLQLLSFDFRGLKLGDCQFVAPPWLGDTRAPSICGIFAGSGMGWPLASYPFDQFDLTYSAETSAFPFARSRRK